MNIIDLKLSEIEPAANIRTGKHDPAELKQLKASIHALGLIENLVVKPNGENTPTYTLVAGHRRFAAIQLLIDEKKWAPEDTVPCAVLDEDQLHTEVALAENTQRSDLDPVDEAMTFQALVESGMKLRRIAQRFGISELLVKRRLALTTLHEDILKLIKDKKMSLEMARAFTLTADKDLQKKILDNIIYQTGFDGKEPLPCNAEFVRETLNDNRMPANNPMAVFVGEGYNKAGGKTVMDLFADPKHNVTEWLLDQNLLRKLTLEKLESEVASAYADTGLGFVHVMEEYDNWHVWSSYTEPPTDWLIDPDAPDKGVKPEHKDKTGVYITLNDEGSAVIKENLVLKTAAQAPGQSTGVNGYQNGHADTSGKTTEQGHEDGSTTHSGTTDTGETETEENKDNACPLAKFQYTNVLEEEVAHLKRSVIAAHLAAHTDLALDVLHYELVVQSLGPIRDSNTLEGSAHDRYVHSSNFHQSAVEVSGMRFNPLPVIATNRDRFKEVDLGRSSLEGQIIAAKIKDEELTYEGWTTLDTDRKKMLTALAVAMTYRTVARDGTGRHYDTSRRIEETLEIEWCDWMQLTQDQYFGRLKKNQIMALIKAQLDNPEKFEHEHRNDTKKLLASLAENLFNPEATDTNRFTAFERARAKAFTIPGFAGGMDVRPAISDEEPEDASATVQPDTEAETLPDFLHETAESPGAA